MNALGDDYVSFVPMHISFSPDGQFILISTGKPTTYTYIPMYIMLILADQDRLILYSWNNGKQVYSHGSIKVICTYTFMYNNTLYYTPMIL